MHHKQERRKKGEGGSEGVTAQATLFHFSSLREVRGQSSSLQPAASTLRNSNSYSDVNAGQEG